MRNSREIWADYDQSSIVIYQAYGDDIANPAIKAQQFVKPFSFTRMTWIKPSFLWLMHRSNWGTKRGQERILSVRISRSSFEYALSEAVPTAPEPSRYRDPSVWESEFSSAKVHVQWDTERNLRGTGLSVDSLQLGISRHLIEDFATKWILRITDLTPTVRSIRKHLLEGREDNARKLLPPERRYPLASSLAKAICASEAGT